MCDTELLPCPYCGSNILELDNFGDYELDTFHTGWFVACYECPNQGVEGHGFTREQAILAWNRREPITKT